MTPIKLRRLCYARKPAIVDFVEAVLFCSLFDSITIINCTWPAVVVLCCADTFAAAVAKVA